MTPDDTAKLLERLERDTDPEVVAEGNRRRAAYAEKVRSWGNPMRCKTNVVDQDGSCFACGAINGEACRSHQALRPGGGG